MMTKQTGFAVWQWVGFAVMAALVVCAMSAGEWAIGGARVSLVAAWIGALVATVVLGCTVIGDFRRWCRSSDNDPGATDPSPSTPASTPEPSSHDDKYARRMAQIDAEHAVNLEAIKARTARHKVMLDELTALRLRLFKTTDADQQERLDVQREMSALSMRAIDDEMPPWALMIGLVLPWLLHRGDETERALAAMRASKDGSKP